MKLRLSLTLDQAAAVAEAIENLLKRDDDQTGQEVIVIQAERKRIRGNDIFVFKTMKLDLRQEPPLDSRIWPP